MAKKLNETLGVLGENYGKSSLMAAIANMYDIDDGNRSVDEIVEEYGSRPEVEDELKVELHPFFDAVDEDRIYNFLERYMVWLANAVKKEEKEKAATPVAPAPEKTQDKPTPATVTAAPASVPAPVQTKTQDTVTPATAATVAPVLAPVQTVQPVQPVQPAPQPATPSYPSFIPDDWEAQFTDWDAFQQCLEDISATEEVYSHDEDLLAGNSGAFDPVQQNLKISAILDSPMMAGQIAQKMGTTPDTVLSSMNSQGGTGLSMSVDGKEIPIGSSAMAGVCARAGFTADGFERHMNQSAETAAQELNGQFDNGSGGTTIIINCGKVRAVNSARFACGNIAKIAETFRTYQENKYPIASVNKMYVSHTLTSWELDLSAYKDDIFKSFPELKASGYNPVYLFATSNTANAAFRITPALKLPNGTTVPIAEASHSVRVRHTGTGNFSERVNQLMAAVCSSYQSIDAVMALSADKLNKLKNIQVGNAVNALLRGLDNIGMPRKQGREAAENFRSAFGTGTVTATAFDCFIAVANAYSFFARDNAGDAKAQFATSLCVGKAIDEPWDAYGRIPGEYKGY